MSAAKFDVSSSVDASMILFSISLSCFSISAGPILDRVRISSAFSLRYCCVPISSSLFVAVGTKSLFDSSLSLPVLTLVSFFFLTSSYFSSIISGNWVIPSIPFLTHCSKFNWSHRTLRDVKIRFVSRFRKRYVSAG